MAKPIQTITPPDRLEKWKKLWATPKLLTEEETDSAFDEFTEAMVPTHMHKLFLKTFGQPRAHFGNRFFTDAAQYQQWNTRLSTLGAGEDVHVEATTIYATTEKMEAHRLRGETRRTLRDIVLDDWHTSISIVRAPEVTLYLFIQPKMTGCLVKVDRPETAEQKIDEPD